MADFCSRTSVLIALVIFASSCVHSNRPHYKYVDDGLPLYVWKLANEGWELYKQGEFETSSKGGHYTDPTPETRTRNFWSDGNYAKFDRGDDGHLETIFAIHDGDLVYMGVLGGDGTFYKVGDTFEGYLGNTLKSSLGYLNLKRGGGYSK